MLKSYVMFCNFQTFISTWAKPKLKLSIVINFSTSEKQKRQICVELYILENNEVNLKYLCR